MIRCLESTNWVQGEVFHLHSPEILDELDQYEGTDFARVEVTVILDSGDPLPCWVYEYNRPVEEVRRIPRG